MPAGASHSNLHPRLRLTGGDPEAHDAWSQQQRARLAVIKENRIAAHGGAAAIDPNDPCWRLAMQTQAALQGPTLAPERRDRLMHNARQLGLRPFEANLVIAVVQDRARQTGAAPASDIPATLAMPCVASRVAISQSQLLKSPAAKWPASWLASCLRWTLALLSSATVAVLLARWIIQGS